ncbi:MAG: diguanylate cyclase [Desulfobulbaceae bacterium]|nr:diguanylate cyclase [Desulfobulbaceae bacterium]
MDQTLKKTILGYIFETASDEILLRKVNELRVSKGVAVYQTLFKLLAGIDIPQEKVDEHWEKALDHRQEMIQLLGRNIDTTTALSDYLQTSTNLLNHPRLIEASFYENIFHETIHDKLTGLFNRPYFDEAYNQQISLAKRYHNDFAVLFLDIDNFKDINDTYGHLAGDEALRQIAEVIHTQKRDSDVAARYGGEEFVLLLTHTDNVSGYIFAERLRQAIENLKVYYHDQCIRLTISGGIASFPFNSSNPEQLLQMADNAVYLSKGAGKNRISHFKKEKRRYLRVKIHQPILAKELDFNNSQAFAGTSKDICVGGILFVNDSPLPLGALIKVKVPVSDGPPVMLIGTVVRVESHENGRYDIGMTTSFKEMDKIANTEIGSILRSKNVS